MHATLLYPDLEQAKEQGATLMELGSYLRESNTQKKHTHTSKGDLRNKYILMHLSLGNGARNLIGAHGLFIGALANTKEETDKDQGQGDEKPK